MNGGPPGIRHRAIYKARGEGLQKRRSGSNEKGANAAKKEGRGSEAKWKQKRKKNRPKRRRSGINRKARDGRFEGFKGDRRLPIVKDPQVDIRSCPTRTTQPKKERNGV